MEAAGMLLPGRRKRRRRRKARAGEVDSPKKEMNEEEEEEGDEEEEEEKEEEEEEEEGEEKEEREEKHKEEEEDEAKEEPKNLSSSNDGKTSEEDLEHNIQAQVLQLLDELEETREIVLKHEEDAMELQGLLEEERLASAHQAEIFTKQIQHLQAQMHVRKDEFDSLQETKEAELGQVSQDLEDANEQIQNLRLEAEESAAVHENEIASLQEELCRLKAELEKAQQVHNEYEMELTALRAEIQMIQNSAPENASEPQLQEEERSSPNEEIARLKGELETSRAQHTDLKEEFQTLLASNKLMVHQLEKLEAMKYKYRNKFDDSPSVESISQWPTDRRYSLMKQPTNHKGSCVSFWSVEIVGVASDYNEEERMEKVEEENEHDPSHQLVEEEEKVEKVQTKGDLSQCTLAEMETEDQPCYQDLDFKKKPRRRRESETRKVQFSMPEMEREDQSSNQDPGSKRRLRSEESQDWRESSQNGQSLSDQEPAEGPGREGQNEQAQHELWELEEQYRHSQYEWELLQEELCLCKEEIERLNGNIPTGIRVPEGGMMPFGVFSLCALGLMLYSCLKKFNSWGSLT